jgi:tRNA modification GTPase
MTVFALSTAQGQSGVAIIRVSGPFAEKVIKKLTKKKLKPRMATLCKIYKNDKEIIDESVVIFFEKNKSFTGEPVAEFQTHGSIAIISAVLSEIAKIKGLRPAEPGEFTKRAYLSGKINLVQVEGLADLIAAQTERQRQQAIMQYGEEASNKYLKWAEEIKTCLAFIETSIDFSDEDIPVDLLKRTRKIAKKVQKEINDHLKTEQQNEIIKEGIRIAIIGRANSGKSSLINYLSKKETSIISSKPGTTRDVLRAERAYDGIFVTLIDTAGLRKAKNKIEVEGLKRAKKESDLAHIRIFLGSNNEKNPFSGLNIKPSANDIVVINKSDLKKKHNIKPNLTISLKEKTKLNILETKIKEKIRKIASPHTGAILTKERQKNHLICTETALRNIGGGDIEIISLNIRDALSHIGSITKESNNEEILGIIFSKFCIGK